MAPVSRSLGGQPSESERTVTIVDPATDEEIVIDLDRVSASSSVQGYREFHIAVGPFRHFYLAAVFRADRAINVVGPAANAASALVLAKCWVDEHVSPQWHVDTTTRQIVLRLMQHLDALRHAPAAVIRATEEDARHAIDRESERLCETMAADIHRLARCRSFCT